MNLPEANEAQDAVYRLQNAAPACKSAAQRPERGKWKRFAAGLGIEIGVAEDGRLQAAGRALPGGVPGEKTGERR